jgi:hypothetical protein
MTAGNTETRLLEHVLKVLQQAAPALAEKIAREIAPVTISQGHFIQNWLSGEMLSTKEAAEILQLDPATVINRCTEAEDCGEAIGIKFGTVWIVSADLLVAGIANDERRIRAEFQKQVVQKRIRAERAKKAQDFGSFEKIRAVSSKILGAPK